MIYHKIIKPIWLTLVIILIVGCYSIPVFAFDIFLGTHEKNSFSYFTGRLIEREINKANLEINCKVLPGPGGDVHNLTNLSQGSLDIALIDSLMLHDAINKTGNFKFFDINYQNLSIITPIYKVPVTLVTTGNSKIMELNDLKGKRVNAGAYLSLQNLFFNSILRAKKWNKNDFSLVAQISDSGSQDRMAFCYGEVDAMLHIGVHPDSSLQQLFRLCKADLADMNDDAIEIFVKSHKAFSKVTIPSNTYPAQKRDIKTFGTQTLLVASIDLDKETVSAILDIIFQNRLKFPNAHPALALNKTDIDTIDMPGIKLHPGAIQYFSK